MRHSIAAALQADYYVACGLLHCNKLAIHTCTHKSLCGIIQDCLDYRIGLPNLDWIFDLPGIQPKIINALEAFFLILKVRMLKPDFYHNR